MSEPNALKILTSIPSNDKENYYLSNQKDSTFILVPKSVFNTIKKIHKSPNEMRHTFVNVLAMAINKRKLDDVSEALSNWINSSNKDYYYPQCVANTAFSKIISTFHRDICPDEFSEKEIKQLIIFFAKCPHGYEVTKLIRANIELNPIIT